MLEKDIQAQIVNFCKAHKIDVIPSFSGVYIANYGTLNFMKTQGLSKGVPDLFFPYAKNMKDEHANTYTFYSGLFIELKKDKKSRPTVEQIETINNLNERGYKAVVCYGYDEAIKMINEYFGIKEL